ncbi:MAG: Gldg family protein [Planctomycetota bacterium]
MSVVKSVFKRNLASFFGSPAGYVFIILFVGLTAWFAFVTEGFFAANQANLNMLTYRMPMLLMIFVASVTMSTWAEEKKLGTDELLFTLPCHDMPIVMGKFLADLAVFSAALLFTLSHVLILMHLGDPDLGLIFATYLGYWLMGAAFIATGMFASSLTNNLTVGFIFGVLFCAVFAFAQDVALVIPGRFGSGINSLAAITHLESFSRGVVALKDIVYFFSIIIGMLYLNTLVLGRRRWPGGSVPLAQSPKFHLVLRVAAVAVILLSSNVLFARFGGRLDVTEERLSSLSDETYQILEELSPDRPVYIQAWVSDEMPETYLRTRDTLLGLLKEYDERGGDAVQVKVYRPERYSQEAQDAKDKFEIYPMPVFTRNESGSASDEIFMGAAFICGVEESVVPFFHPGIAVEYELTRTLRVVSKAERPKVGIIDNELKLLGGFDFQSRSQDRPWQIVEELKKQYDVDTLKANSKIPDDIDVIVSALPSLLKEEEEDNLIEAIRSGKPTLLLMDPLPLQNIGLSPRLPRPSPQSNPYMQQRQQGEPKCDLNKLMSMLGVRWSQDTIAWDTVNPYTMLRHLTPEFVFIRNNANTGDGKGGFSPDDPITAGLQELLTFFAGSLSKATESEGNLTFEPLLRTGTGTSGTINWNKCVQQSFFGPQLAFDALSRMPRNVTLQNYILAARVRGELPIKKKDDKKTDEAEEAAENAEETAEKEAPPEMAKIDVILVADLDFISDQFFEIRKNKVLELDNIPFVLNCVDSLAGEDSYISLRKRRKLSRTLTTIENIEKEYEQAKMLEEANAEAEAQGRLANAQMSFDEKVQAVENRTDLDMRTKEIMMASVRKDEERKLAAKKATIDEEKNKKLESSRFAMEKELRKLRVHKKYWAVALPIIPPLIIAILLFFIKRARENRGAAKTRLVRN